MQIYYKFTSLQLAFDRIIIFQEKEIVKSEMFQF